MPVSRSRRGRNPAGPTISLEKLERRDCPAAIGIVGSSDVSEAAGVATITVTLSAAEKRPVSVDYRLEGTATSGSDYRLTSGTTNAGFPTGTITFKPGEVSKTLTVNVMNDVDRESSETVKVSLFKPRNATLDASQSATVTILDDDSYTARITGAARVNEGATGVYEIVLSSPATRAETFYVNTVPGSATQGIDYRPLTQVPLVIKKGETRKSFRFQALQDAVSETDEFLFLAAAPASRGFPAVSNAGVTIAGNGPAARPQLSIANATVFEGDAGPTAAAVLVTLSAAFSDPVTFRYQTTDGSATQASGDYQSASGTVTIPAGETSAIIVVNALGDTVLEKDESFTITISAPVNAVIANAVGTVTITNDDSAFRIDVVFPDNTLSPSQRQAFRTAANRWSQIITADLPDVLVNGRTIDDLEISATGPSIDGPYGILGQAGPRAMRTTGTQLPYTGVMRFDSADLSMMESTGTLTGVILHEMGHVLGLGTLWERKGFLDVTDATNPLYVGANALREYNTLTGTTAAGVPVESTGGPGTALGHWRESVFRTELMTGYAEPAGVAMPISRLTVGSLEDLGYTVNYGAADAYTIPAVNAPLISGRRVAAVAADQRMLLLQSVSPADLFCAVIERLNMDAAASLTPRQKAFAIAARI
jgi:hypothetical protein